MNIPETYTCEILIFEIKIMRHNGRFSGQTP